MTFRIGTCRTHNTYTQMIDSRVDGNINRTTEGGYARKRNLKHSRKEKNNRKKDVGKRNMNAKRRMGGEKIFSD